MSAKADIYINQIKMNKELKQKFRELARILNPPTLEQIKKEMSNLYEKCDELERSRDSWRSKYELLQKEELKKELIK